MAVSPAAEAASLKADFTCATTLGDQVLTVTTKVSFPAKLKKGKSVPAKSVAMKVVLPEALADGLRFIGVTKLSGTATGVKATVGSTKVPLNDVGFTDVPVPESGPMTVTAKGKTTAFSIKKPGTYTISIPKKFLFTSTDQNGNVLTDDAPCSLNSGEPKKIGTLKVTK